MNWFRSRQDEEIVEDEDATQRGATRERIPEEAESYAAEVIEKERDWWLKPLWTLTALMLFIGGLWSLYLPVWEWLDKPVAEVKVTGPVRHLDKPALSDNVASTLEAGLLGIDIATVREQVVSHPWVRNAGVIRDWPQTLEIRVEEEVPVARWGEDGLLNHEGEIFWPELKKEYVQLPRLSGAAEDTEQVMAQFHDLNQMFRRIGLKVVALDLEKRGAWSLVLDNGIRVVVGRSAVNERLERFLDLYTRVLSARAEQIELVDIRYANGVSVKWKPEANDENAG